MNFRNILKTSGPFLPGIAVALCAAGSLSGYEMPTFEPAFTQVVEAAEKPAAPKRKSYDSSSAKKTAAVKAEVDGAVSLDNCEDGTYEGSGQGFQGGKTTVRVTIKDHRITAIEVVDHQDTDSYFERARSVIDLVLSTQSLEVDVVSGATYSSQGIIEAISNALKRAAGQTVSDNYTGSTGFSAAEGGSVSISASTPDNLKDGTYTGSAEGFSGPVTVSVTVSSGRITDVQVLSHSDTPSYFSMASSLCDSIVQNNGVNGLDAVSGATYSSRGILQAVANALSGAGGSAAVSVVSTGGSGSASSGSSSPVSIEVLNTPDTLKDGTYTGSGEGFGGTTTLSVTVKGGKISSIDVMEHNDTPSFFSMTSDLLDQIVQNNGVNGIDAVSGATYSSQGILEAVQDALDRAAAVTEAAKQKEIAADSSVSNCEPDKEVSKDSETVDPEIISAEDGSDSENTEKSDSEKDTPEDQNLPENARYLDGTYTASKLVDPGEDGDFLPYTLSMDLTIEDGMIKSFDNVLGSGEGYEDSDLRYINRALNGTKKLAGVAQQVFDKNGLEDVDTISGATWTSEAMIEMIREMLALAEPVQEIEDSKIIELQPESETEISSFEISTGSDAVRIKG